MKKALILLSTVLSALLLSHCAAPAGGGGGSTMGGQTFTNSVGMKLVPVPGTAISMSTTETTLAQWQAAGLGGGGGEGTNYPVHTVSWDDAQKYCRWLSRKEGRRYRLPTDHEWSCAVGIGHLENPLNTPAQKDGAIKNVFPWGSGRPSGRAGNYRGEEARNANFFGSNTSCIAGYNDGYVRTAPVGSYAANKLGIYDLGGNVWEWCQDQYGSGSSARVLRGASYNNAESDNLLSSNRNNNTPDNRNNNNGFRLVFLP